MQRYLFFLLPFLFSVTPGVLAQTVIYTTKFHPVAEPEPGVIVQVLEDVQRLEPSLFPSLSSEPTQAQRQAELRMRRPDWKAQEARLIRAYQALTDAYMLGIKKVPAVVFDDRYVIYGTTDVRLAEQKLNAWQEQQP
ncbi:TIGR03757 family integrating conjugative element protein [Erwinia psidii]|uniref:TIGR03757 family integrating conjugative element protein n=1 Tax=Erwinia psidii TaxID=69224 RepID=UPI00226BB1C3|nr:TIGR03757 family integrating conjugative element protein [Erwinia psidii]